MLRLVLLLAVGSGDLASLVPADAVVYAEVREPHALFERLRGSVLNPALLETPEAKAFAASPQGRGLESFLRALRGTGIGSPADALERVAAGGIALALLPPPQVGGPPRVLLLVRGSDEDPECAVRALESAGFIASLSRKGSVRRLPDDVVSIGGKVFAAAEETLLVASSHEDLLREVLRSKTAADRPSLASRAPFREALAATPGDADAVLFVDAATIAAARPDGRLFPEEKRDFGQALLFGGVASTAEAAPWIAGSFAFREGEARLSFHAPEVSSEIPDDVRATFFGGGEPPARVAAPTQTAVVLRLRRNLEALWAARETLGFDDEGLRTASPVFFGGRRFEDELLPEFGEEIDFFVCRRTFEEFERPPEIRLPGFALVLALRDPVTFGPEAVAAFQTAIGLANVARGQEGKPGFRLSTETHGDVEIHVARLRAWEPDDPLPIEANLTPSCAVAGSRFFLAADPGTLRALLDAGLAPEPRGGDSLSIDAANVLAMLRENEEALVSNDMLEKGRDRAAAQDAVRIGFRLLESAANAGISTRAEEGGWTLTFGLRLR